ncbi:MAG: hypothetical protein LBQ43_00085 [Holosporales bacterium]|nr:hypothetical protein [Holosporales bacterium]
MNLIKKTMIILSACQFANVSQSADLQMLTVENEQLETICENLELRNEVLSEENSLLRREIRLLQNDNSLLSAKNCYLESRNYDLEVIYNSGIAEGGQEGNEQPSTTLEDPEMALVLNEIVRLRNENSLLRRINRCFVKEFRRQGDQ